MHNALISTKFFKILFFMVSSILIHVQYCAISILSSPIMNKEYLFSETAKVGHLWSHPGMFTFIGQTRKFLFTFNL